MRKKKIKIFIQFLRNWNTSSLVPHYHFLLTLCPSPSFFNLVGRWELSNAWFTFSSWQYDTRREREWEWCIRLVFHTLDLFSSRLGALARHVGKSVPSQREWECLECLASLSTILAWECECLRSCIICLIHISPEVSTSTQDENVNQA